MSWRIEGFVSGEAFRAAAQPWLKGEEFAEPLTITGERWPGAVVDGDRLGAGQDLSEVHAADAIHFDYDLISGSTNELRAILSNFLSDQLAEEITLSGSNPPLREASAYSELRSLRVGKVVVDRIDLPVATVSQLDGWAFGVRRCLAFVSDRWLIAIHSTFITPDEMHDGPPMGWDLSHHKVRRTLPAMDGPLPPEDAGSGQALLGRLARRFVRHLEWSLGVTQEALVRWDARFLRDHSSLDSIRDQTDSVAAIGQATACVDYGARALHRRAERQPLLELPERELLLQRCEDVREGARVARAEVRESFGLTGQAASAVEAAITEDRARRTHRFEVAAGVVTAFVLVPGLVLGFYGANVDGLPGQYESSGLIYMGIAAAVSGVVTIALLIGLMRQPREVAGLRSKGFDGSRR